MKWNTIHLDSHRSRQPEKKTLREKLLEGFWGLVVTCCFIVCFLLRSSPVSVWRRWAAGGLASVRLSLQKFAVHQGSLPTFLPSRSFPYEISDDR